MSLNASSRLANVSAVRPIAGRWASIVIAMIAMIAGVSIACGPVARGDDWPQWMGPNRDGVWRESGLVKSIPPAGLPVKWRVDVKGGYSGPAVADGRVYLMDYDRREGDIANAPNDRTTLAGRERVLCLDAATGRVIWSKDFKKDYSAPTPLWGFCGHPLVDGNRVVCLVGGEGSVAVAFDKDTGRELWRALSASESGYCPPSIIESAGVRQLLIWDADKLNGLDPATGTVLWSQPLKPSYGMSIMAPRVATTKQGQVLFASGIGRVGALYTLAADKPGATIAWRGDPKSAVYCANSTPFIAGDTLYGCDCETGFLTAVDLATGQRLWETGDPTLGDRRGRHGTAFLVRQGDAAADDRTWLFSETGDLILARLTPAAYEELGRVHLVAPTNECFGREVVWSHPAFAARCIFVRNDRELVCVSLAE